MLETKSTPKLENGLHRMLTVKYNAFNGRILNAQLSVQYKISKHWEIDLGYTDFDVKVGFNRKRLNADFDWNYNGPFLTGVYKFGK